MRFVIACSDNQQIVNTYALAKILIRPWIRFAHSASCRKYTESFICSVTFQRIVVFGIFKNLIMYCKKIIEKWFWAVGSIQYFFRLFLCLFNIILTCFFRKIIDQLYWTDIFLIAAPAHKRKRCLNKKRIIVVYAHEYSVQSLIWNIGERHIKLRFIVTHSLVKTSVDISVVFVERIVSVTVKCIFRRAEYYIRADIYTAHFTVLLSSDAYICHTGIKPYALFIIIEISRFVLFGQCSVCGVPYRVTAIKFQRLRLVIISRMDVRIKLILKPVVKFLIIKIILKRKLCRHSQVLPCIIIIQLVFFISNHIRWQSVGKSPLRIIRYDEG